MRDSGLCGSSAFSGHVQFAAVTMSIRELLAAPFGDYNEKEIFNDKCKSTRRSLVTISDLNLKCDGEAIGLDESERQPSRGDRTDKFSVRFSGLVEIKFCSWLTPEGCQRIEADMRRRDNEKRGERAYVPVGKISLEQLYAKHDSPKVKVRILGKKGMSVSFLTSDLLPRGMLFSSRDTRNRDRQYEVKSLHTDILGLSRNFIARYRLLALMQDIIDTDDQRTHPSQHTSDFFINSYVRRYMANTAHHLHLRYIYELDNDNVDLNDGPMCRDDVEQVFAGQSEWIYADQITRRRVETRVVAVKDWRSFCLRVRDSRRRARDRGLRWGLPYGGVDEEYFKAEIDLSHFSIVGVCKEQMQEAAKRARQSDRRPAKSPSVSPSSRNADDPEEVIGQITYHTYDSDFSDASTPPATDSDSEPENVDPDIMASIPRYFWYPPELPDAGFKWHCPMQSCEYVIDMLRLNTANVFGLPPREVQYLRSQVWSSIREDERVKENFYIMVNRHYEHHHLRRIGIKLTYKSNDKVVPQWIHPNQHRPWPP